VSQTNRIVLLILGGLLLVGIAWYSVWFFENFERHEREVRSDISPQARKNRLLAAEHFLVRLGRKAESRAGRGFLSELPPAGDTLYISRLSSSISEEKYQSLIQWIESGGHLILDTAELWENDAEDNLLLRHFGAELDDEWELENKDLEATITEDDEEAESIKNGEAVAEEDERKEDDECVPCEVEENLIVTIPSDSSDRPVQMEVDPYLWLRDRSGEANWRVSSRKGAHILEYKSGQGLITLLSDGGIFHNDRIGEQDHAFLLAMLTEDADKVWFLFSSDMPSLPVLLWQRFPFLVSCVLILLLLGGWRLSTGRSGPLLFPRAGERRNLLEHVEATAQYGWRTNRSQQLFINNRDTIEQAWRRRHPGLNRMERTMRCEWIGEKSGLSASAVERVLYGEFSAEEDFIRASSVLQRLAASLHIKQEKQ
jgi:hypothetical protein